MSTVLDRLSRRGSGGFWATRLPVEVTLRCADAPDAATVTRELTVTHARALRDGLAICEDTDAMRLARQLDEQHPGGRRGLPARSRRAAGLTVTLDATALAQCRIALDCALANYPNDQTRFAAAEHALA